LIFWSADGTGISSWPKCRSGWSASLVDPPVHRVRLRPHCRRVRRPAQRCGRLRRRRRRSVRHGAPGARAHQAWIWIAGDGGRAVPEAVFGNGSDPGPLW